MAASHQIINTKSFLPIITKSNPNSLTNTPRKRTKKHKTLSSIYDTLYQTSRIPLFRTNEKESEMKWSKKRHPTEVRPFLVLPLLEDERSVSADPTLPASGNSTGTWPPKLKLKKKTKSKRIERPLTATLDHPELLNINLLDKLDMSLVRKEFLCITNLCKDTLSLSNPKKKLGKLVPAAKSVEQNKRSRKTETSEESDENLSVRRKVNKQITKVVKNSDKNDANNNVDSITNRSNVIRSKDTSLSPIVRALPEPCKTCGRPDAPERFHSHPATPQIRQSPRKNPAVKSTVQKPVAIKYKSREKSPIKSDKKEEKMGPRTLVCYLCGREFGTKSLPLHEPKCLRRWERENNELPRHLRRKVPIKPDKPMTSEEWNKFAWEASQASLTKCPNCTRTFLPDRLEVHLRSCKPKKNQTPAPIQNKTDLPLTTNNSTVVSSPNLIQCSTCDKKFGSKSIAIHEPQCLKKWQAENDKSVTSTKTSQISNSNKKPMVPCYICGRQFGNASITIHEPQCLKKWHAENDKLPINQKRNEPVRPETKFTNGKIDYEATNDALWQSHLSQLVPCKMCGRTFNPDRVEVHERSCKGNS